MKNWLKSLNFFVNLKFKDKILFIKTFVLLIVIKVLFETLSFRRFKQAYTFFFSKKKNNITETEITKIVSYITIISNKLPVLISCLVQALTAKLLIGLKTDTKLIIGINYEKETFKAHAWVTKNNKILIGDSPSEVYTPLWEWQ